MAKVAIFLSLVRQVLLLLPLLLILPRFLGLDGVWISMPISDFIAFGVAAITLWWVEWCRKKIPTLTT